jgi:hypothetical protein
MMHEVLAESHVVLRLRMDEKDQEIPLTPVIARVSPEKRVLPHGRIVYEPHATSTAITTGSPTESPGRGFRLDKFDTVEMELEFPCGTRMTVPLRGGGGHFYTRMYQYYRFERFEGGVPVHLFLKDLESCSGVGEEGGIMVRLHCVSVPVKFLRGVIRGKIGVGGR